MKTIYLSMTALAVAFSVGAAPLADAQVRTRHGVFTNGRHTITGDARVERGRGFRERDATFTGENGRQRNVHDERTWDRADGTYDREHDVTGVGGRTRSVDVEAQRMAPGAYSVDRTVTGRNGETRSQSGDFTVARTDTGRTASGELTGSNGRTTTWDASRTRTGNDVTSNRDVTFADGTTRSVELDRDGNGDGTGTITRSAVDRRGETHVQSGSYEVSRGP